MMNCQELTQVMTDYLEGRLPLRRRLAIKMHLFMCRHCTEYVRQMRATIRALGSLPHEAITPPMRDDLLRVFDRWNR
jgi:anti-sigma factor RsiW